MKMTIEEAHRILSHGVCNAPSEHDWCVAFIMALDIMNEYQQLQTDYEARLKADMVVMLEEIQKEIKELNTYDIERTHGLIEDSYVTTDVNDIIQQKIDSLKKQKDENVNRQTN